MCSGQAQPRAAEGNISQEETLRKYKNDPTPTFGSLCLESGSLLVTQGLWGLGVVLVKVMVTFVGITMALKQSMTRFLDLENSREN